MHSPLRLLTVGSLIKRKRVDLIVRVVEIVDKKKIPVQLRVIGDGAELGTLKTLAAELGVAGQIDFVGAVAPGEVIAHLRWADVFLFASESEGRPNAILEAMGASLPVIAIDIPGVNELLENEHGVLVASADAQSLAKEVVNLHARPEIALRIGQRGWQKIQSQGLQWSTTASRYAAVYESVGNNIRPW